MQAENDLSKVLKIDGLKQPQAKLSFKDKIQSKEVED
jgi:hypothetical protein